MPSYSPKQARTMAAAAHNPQFAKKVGIPQGVAQDFNKADTGTAQLKQAMAARQSRAAMQAQMESSPQHQRMEPASEKAREKRLGIP